MVGDDFADGGDGLMDGRPEFVFGRGVVVVGVCRDEDDLVLGRVSNRYLGDFRGGQEVPVEVRLEVRVPMGVKELVVVDVVVMFQAQGLPR